MRAKLIVALTLTAVMVSVYSFWDAIFSWAQAQSVEKAMVSVLGRGEKRSIKTPAQARSAPGVPADTITQAAKVARDLRETSVAYEQGTTVERNHATAMALKARADSIEELIAEIKKQPVTGKPADAEKKLPSLKALRRLAQLDE